MLQLPSTDDIRFKFLGNFSFDSLHTAFHILIYTLQRRSKRCKDIYLVTGFKNVPFVVCACTRRMIEVVNFNSRGIQRHQSQSTSGDDEKNLEVFHDEQMTSSVSCKISMFIVKIAYNYKYTFIGDWFTIPNLLLRLTNVLFWMPYLKMWLFLLVRMFTPNCWFNGPYSSI